ncbi:MULTISPECIES: nucleoside-diphosphate kinase [Lactobacillaceae]|uniref:Nucleoside diphosphate kinase n=1 Tax=Levilactobacillus hammesii TaxID=267633 RepID=A0A921EYT7_9LACO|nr:nucleoside-diphosphate kinase [Lactobacillus sp. HBUAS51381]NLR10076.1 nucleoside-diphosphate kinase [Lactobacillus sp. HBUAS51381]UIF29994.1 nucleoside-diphosphate kinase [Levilactobacillus brevis]HJE86236.1 nucleoside-diphosphate kinase [Levilactobacillus hammesii]
MANSEKTLVLVKPDGVAEGHIGEIISRLESKRYQITALKVLNATTDQLKRHYREQVDKPYFNEIQTYMQEGPLVAIIVTGTDVVKAVHNLAGKTRPNDAQPGTIRGDYAHEYPDGILRNIVHTADSRENAHHEIAIWFPELAVAAHQKVAGKEKVGAK